MKISHSPCLFNNKDFGGWEKVKKRKPWSLFFDYYEIKHEGNIYFERENKLDGIFNWICDKLGLITQR